jgi:cardiolipin synthase
MALAIPISLLLLHEWYGAALLTFMVAGLSDGLDGYLAKRFSWHSRLGSILDPLADKVLLVTNYVVLGSMGSIPLWLVAAVIGRDVIVISGALAYHVLVGRYELAPSFASKVNTALQLVYVVAVVASLGIISLPSWLMNGLIYGVLATTVWSGVDYVWTWGSLAFRARSRSH